MPWGMLADAGRTLATADMDGSLLRRRLVIYIDVVVERIRLRELDAVAAVAVDQLSALRGFAFDGGIRLLLGETLIQRLALVRVRGVVGGEVTGVGLVTDNLRRIGLHGAGDQGVVVRDIVPREVFGMGSRIVGTHVTMQSDPYVPATSRGFGYALEKPEHGTLVRAQPHAARVIALHSG
jgi:hypothetical protein